MGILSSPLLVMQPTPSSFKGCCLFQTPPFPAVMRLRLSGGHLPVLEGIAGLCSALCSAWVVTFAGLFPSGGHTEGGVHVISFFPRGWLCEGAQQRRVEPRWGSYARSTRHFPSQRVTAFLSLESEEARAPNPAVARSRAKKEAG